MGFSTLKTLYEQSEAHIWPNYSHRSALKKKGGISIINAFLKENIAGKKLKFKHENWKILLNSHQNGYFYCKNNDCDGY